MSFAVSLMPLELTRGHRKVTRRRRKSKQELDYGIVKIMALLRVVTPSGVLPVPFQRCVNLGAEGQ